MNFHVTAGLVIATAPLLEEVTYVGHLKGVKGLMLRGGLPLQPGLFTDRKRPYKPLVLSIPAVVVPKIYEPVLNWEGL